MDQALAHSSKPHTATGGQDRLRRDFGNFNIGLMYTLVAWHDAESGVSHLSDLP